MSEAHLTKRAADAARYAGKGRSPTLLRDGKLPGFALRVHPSGRKTFVVRYRTREGRQRWYTVGPYGVLTVDQARGRARKVLAEVADGRDPGAMRGQAKTFRELAEVYLEQHSAPRKRSHRDDVQRIRDYLLPCWAARSATSIRRSDVAQLHRGLESHGIYVANRVLALVSHVFAWGERTGFLPEGHLNPARGVARFKERSRARWLTADELRLVLKAVENEPSIYVRAFIRLLLLTGCRKSELLRLRWENVDLGQGVLMIPQTKAGRVHTLPLSGAAVAEFDKIPREAGNPHVFPGRVPGAALVGIDKPWRQIRDAAGVGDVRLHDLRRTAGSLMAQAGTSLQLIGTILNHSNPSTTQIYAHLTETNRRDAVERLSHAVLDADVYLPASLDDTAWGHESRSTPSDRGAREIHEPRNS